MLLIVALLATLALMALSDKLFGNPVTILGIPFLGFCLWMVGAYFYQLAGVLFR